MTAFSTNARRTGSEAATAQAALAAFDVPAEEGDDEELVEPVELVEVAAFELLVEDSDDEDLPSLASLPSLPPFALVGGVAGTSAPALALERESVR